MVLGTLQTRDQFNNDLNNRYKQVVRQRLEDICLEQGRILVKNLIQNNYFLFSIIKCDFFLGLFADVTFELDDGSVPAHKAILTARCDVMKAMFSGDFRESSAKVVSIFLF